MGRRGAAERHPVPRQRRLAMSRAGRGPSRPLGRKSPSQRCDRKKKRHRRSRRQSRSPRGRRSGGVRGALARGEGPISGQLPRRGECDDEEPHLPSRRVVRHPDWPSATFAVAVALDVAARPFGRRDALFLNSVGPPGLTAPAPMPTFSISSHHSPKKRRCRCCASSADEQATTRPHSGTSGPNRGALPRAFADRALGRPRGVLIPHVEEDTGRPRNLSLEGLLVALALNAAMRRHQAHLVQAARVLNALNDDHRALLGDHALGPRRGVRAGSVALSKALSGACRRISQLDVTWFLPSLPRACGSRPNSCESCCRGRRHGRRELGERCTSTSTHRTRRRGRNDTQARQR